MIRLKPAPARLNVDLGYLFGCRSFFRRSQCCRRLDLNTPHAFRKVKVNDSCSSPPPASLRPLSDFSQTTPCSGPFPEAALRSRFVPTVPIVTRPPSQETPRARCHNQHTAGQTTLDPSKRKRGGSATAGSGALPNAGWVEYVLSCNVVTWEVPLGALGGTFWGSTAPRIRTPGEGGAEHYCT